MVYPALRVAGGKIFNEAGAMQINQITHKVSFTVVQFDPAACIPFYIVGMYCMAAGGRLRLA